MDGLNGSGPSPASPQEVAAATSRARDLYGEGHRLALRGRRGEALAIYDRLLAEIGTPEDDYLRAMEVRALVNKGVLLRKLKRYEDALDVFDQVVTRFGAAKETTVASDIARALVNQGETLRQVGADEEALDAYNEAIARFAEAEEPELAKQVVFAFWYKALVLAEFHERQREAIRMCDEVIARLAARRDRQALGTTVAAHMLRGFLRASIALRRS